MGYLKIRCLICDAAPVVTEMQIEGLGYKCPKCGIAMDLAQWRRVKASYYIALNAEQQAKATHEGEPHLRFETFRTEYYFDEGAEQLYFRGFTSA